MVKHVKKSLVTLLIILLNQSLFAQGYVARVEARSNKWILLDENGKQIGTNSYGHLQELGDGMMAAREGGFWGYVNYKGEMKISPKFSTVYTFSGGIAPVSTGSGAFYYINKKGDPINDDTFHKVLPCTDSVFFAKKLEEVFFRLYDCKGREINPDGQYKEVFPFKNGFGIVRTKDAWQILNKKGEVLYENSECSFIKNEQDGMFAFRSKGKWGFIDSSFKVAVEPLYASYTPFSQNYAIVEVSNGNTIMIGKDGKQVLSITGYSAVGKISEGMIPVRKNEKWGYLNLKGEEVIPCQFLAVKPFSSGIALVKNDVDKWGYINNKGEWKIKPSLMGGKNCRYGFVLVKFGTGSWGYLNSEGRQIGEEYPHAYSYEKVSGNQSESDEDPEAGN